MMRPRTHRMIGQAMVETALLAPFLLLLLLGGMQVAYLGYSAVSIDTAAREGARVAAENAQTALSFTNGTNPSSYTCAADPSTDSNPVCQAVANNAGLLKGQKFALVRIDTNVVVSRKPADDVPGDVAQVGSCSNQNDAQYAGTLSPAVSIAVTDSLGDSTTSDVSGAFTLCMHGTSNTSQTVTITASGTSGSLSCTGQASTSISKSQDQWSADPSSATMSLTCTSTSTSTSTSATTSTTSTSSSTTTSTSSFSSTVSFPPALTGDTCTETPAAGTYVTVTVQYQASILVPLLNTLLADSGKSYKTMSAVVTMRVEPCTT